MIQLVINGKDSKYIIEFSLYNNLNKKRYELINKWIDKIKKNY